MPRAAWRGLPERDKVALFGGGDGREGQFQGGLPISATM